MAVQAAGKANVGDRGAALVLDGQTAEDLMTHNPVSIRSSATVADVARLLTDRNIGAVPVINKQGRPVGVVSRTDVVRYERENWLGLKGRQLSDDPVPEDESVGSLGDGFHIVSEDNTPLTDIMTPLVFSVSKETRVRNVVDLMLEKEIHHVFVVDEADVLVGVISAVDVLKKLK